MKALKIEYMAVLLAALLLVSLLMIKPVIGVADNGDFGRIMGSTGLKYLTDDNRERYFEFVNILYKAVPPFTHYTGYFSSQIALVLAARFLSSIFSADPGVFDIRYLSVIYLVLFLSAIYMLIKYSSSVSPALKALFAALCIFVFTDTAYISYFNSLYGEAVSFIFLLLTVGFALGLTINRAPKKSLLLGFFIAAVFLTGAKLQNAPTGLILILFGLGLLRLEKSTAWKGIIFSSCAILALTMAFSYTNVPENIRICNKYQSLFFGILKDSPSPEQDLRELGINQSYAILAGTNYFMKNYPMDINDPELTAQLNTRINPARVAFFYLKHPGRYVKKLSISAHNGFKLLQGFGNYEKSESGTKKKVVSIFRVWSDFKLQVLPHTLLTLSLFFASYFSIVTAYYIRSKNIKEKLYLEIFFLIGLIGLSQFAIPVIGDGEADLSKHLFLFNVCFDLMLIASLAWFAGNLPKLAKSSLSRLKLRSTFIKGS